MPYGTAERFGGTYASVWERPPIAAERANQGEGCDRLMRADPRNVLHALH